MCIRHPQQTTQTTHHHMPNNREVPSPWPPWPMADVAVPPGGPPLHSLVYQYEYESLKLPTVAISVVVWVVHRCTESTVTFPAIAIASAANSNTTTYHNLSAYHYHTPPIHTMISPSYHLLKMIQAILPCRRTSLCLCRYCQRSGVKF